MARIPHQPPGHNPGSGDPRTVEELAERKRLPVDFLLSLGLQNLSYGRISIPYYERDGSLARVRVRRSESDGDRFYWEKGPRVPVYGLDRIAQPTEKRVLLITEGESDAWVCWHHGSRAIGIPGNTNVSALRPEDLEGIDHLYVVPDNDEGGDTFEEEMLKWARGWKWPGKVSFTRPPRKIKDLADLHADDPARFRERLSFQLQAASCHYFPDRARVVSEVEASPSPTVVVSGSSSPARLAPANGQVQQQLLPLPDEASPARANAAIAGEKVHHQPDEASKGKGQKVAGEKVHHQPDEASKGKGQKKGKQPEGDDDPPSQAVQLRALALALKPELLRDQTKRPLIRVEDRGGLATYPLDSQQFEDWLRWLWEQDEQRIIRGSALTDCAASLAGRARRSGQDCVSFNRVGILGSETYYDLNRTDWAAVRIGPGLCEIVRNHKVVFTRDPNQKEIPEPEFGCDLTMLKDYCNFQDEKSYYLAVVWLAHCLQPNPTFPVVHLTGRAGSAKTTTARRLKQLIDPVGNYESRAPRDEKDAIANISSQWITNIGNMSSMPKWLSDLLCGASTGGEDRQRLYYTNSGIHSVGYTRPVITSSVEQIATQPDFLSRCLAMELAPLPEGSYLDESVLDARFAKDHAKILGAVIEARALALAVKLEGTDAQRFRMVAFAHLGLQMEKALGWPDGSFLEALRDNQGKTDEAALSANPLPGPIHELVKRQGPVVELSMQRLLDALTKIAGEPMTSSKNWPKSPRWLSERLKAIADNLFRSGVKVEWVPVDGKNRTNHIRLTRVD